MLRPRYTGCMLLASVILDIPTQALDAPYAYAVPDPALDGAPDCAAEVGCAVLVPFGNRKAVGFVVGLEDHDDGALPEGIDPAKLKGIERVLSKPYFDEEGAACARFLADEYLAPLSACIRLFTPPGGVPRLVQGRGGWRLEEPAVGEVDDRWLTLGPAAEGFEPRKNAAKQQAIVDVLRRGDVRMAELALEFGSVSGAVKALEAKGVVRVERRRRMRGMDGCAAGFGPGAAGGAGGGSGASGEAGGSAPPAPELSLTEGQQAALDAIEAARATASGQVVVLDGVTGSGKTEVYLRAIASTLGQGRNAFVLVPEISLTPQTVARFRGRFGDAVAVMHSRMSQGERYDQWDFIRSGQARVVVGARSALFTPLRDVGLVIIDEEHEGSYKQDSAPRYHARDVACWMMARAGGAVVLGSATPSIEALHHAARVDGWSAVSLPERANGRPLPAVEVVDMAAEFKGGARAMFSRRLTSALQAELAAGHKAVLLLNQRGFAKFLLCRDCGFVPECAHCATSLTYHDQGHKLVCHHCGHTVPVPPRCPSCESPYLKMFGAGTQRVEAELRQMLDAAEGVGPGVPIVRMDADTTKGKGAHQRLLERFAAAEGGAVLLGTQMIAKGLDFDDVTLVGVINADTQLNLPDYRASERTFALIEQVAGRAGRAQLEGRVLVQTYDAGHSAIAAAAAYDRPRFLRDELPKRRALGYPPYVRMANVLVWGRDEEAVRAAAEALRAQLVELKEQVAGDAWQVFEAQPCVLAKLRNVYRYHVLVKCPPDDDLPGKLALVFRRRKADPAVNVAVDIDPMDLL